ncbi:MAG: DUF262 domain-containing protein, partial [Oscillospiraceae bacterium]|nr:DUF262 domain-containing protein [Oscillospiraceae bacterium]
MAKKTTASYAKPKTDTITIDGKSYQMMCVDVRQDGTVTEIPMRIKEFCEDMQREKISRDTLIQREVNQWGNALKSNLILSILINRPIGTILTATGRDDTQNYAVNSLLDGLQRSSAIFDFVNNKFKLSSKLKPIICKFKDTESGEIVSKEYVIAGKKFKQLPEILRDTILNYRLTVYSYKGFADDELDNILYCVNSGKAPTSYQKMRFALGSNVMRTIQPMCESTLWEDISGCNSKNDSILCCIIRILMMISHYFCNSYGISDMNKFIDDFDNNIKMSAVSETAVLIGQLADVKFEMSDNEIETLTACSIPHIVMNMKKFNEMRKPDETRNYLDCYKAFLESDDYKKFLEHSQSGSGGSQYSADNVED